jgi:hypothetical protein
MCRLTSTIYVQARAWGSGVRSAYPYALIITRRVLRPSIADVRPLSATMERS